MLRSKEPLGDDHCPSTASATDAVDLAFGTLTEFVSSLAEIMRNLISRRIYKG